MIFPNSSLSKSRVRLATDAMVEAWKAQGGKIRRIANQGKAPHLPNHYCDPRNRELFFSTSRAVRAVPVRMTMGTSQLIKR